MISATDPVMLDLISPQASKGTVDTNFPVQSRFKEIENNPLTDPTGTPKVAFTWEQEYSFSA